LLQILKELPSLRDDKLIISYAKKAICVNVSSTPREPRLTISGSRAKSKKPATPAKSNFVQSLGNFQREARKAFSWVQTPPKDVLRKRKSSSSGGDRSWEAMPGVQEERTPVYPSEGQERLPFVSAPEEWVLTGDPIKDDATRSCHRYETSPDITLFKVCPLCHPAKHKVIKIWIKGSPVHVAPTCIGSREASNHFGSYVRSLSLHFCKSLFPGLGPMTSWSQGNSFTTVPGLPFIGCILITIFTLINVHFMNQHQLQSLSNIHISNLAHMPVLSGLANNGPLTHYPALSYMYEPNIPLSVQL
jgi:hypothetical protein